MSTTVIEKPAPAAKAETQTGEFTKEELETIKSMWESGHSRHEICAALGIGYEMLRYRLVHSGYVLDAEQIRTMRVKRPSHVIDGCE